MSDCFVVSGAVGWAPNISSTYIMSCEPHQGKCSGGNPAAVAPFLERNGVADDSCIDYSWCSGDAKLCTSIDSAKHFGAKVLGKKLNAQVPSCGCYYSNVKKYFYRLQPGSDTISIDYNTPVEVFRKSVKAHILDFGPTVGGYVVLKNFLTGYHTNESINGGVYFDRADYNNGLPLRFSNRIMNESQGLHAVSIVGWGIAKQIQYDTNKIGDVPFWHCRNSWGTKWGNQKGYFKIAMYPFNKVAQFDKQTYVTINNRPAGPIGSMVLLRGTTKPEALNSKSTGNISGINKQKSLDYYKSGPEQVQKINSKDLLNLDIVQNNVQTGWIIQRNYTIEFYVLIIVLIILIFL